MNKEVIKFFGILFLAVTVLTGMVSAAVGVYITQESVLGAPGETVCLSYGAYNPLEDDVTIEVGVSDNLKDLFVSSDWDENRKFISGNTLSSSAVPVEVCFEVPQDAYAGDRKCEGETRVYSGTVTLTEVKDENIGGSSTTVSAAGPANIRVSCVPQTRNYAVFLLITLIILAIAIIVLFTRKFLRKKVEDVTQTNNMSYQNPGSDNQVQ